jgi:hypothetical protein
MEDLSVKSIGNQ